MADEPTFDPIELSANVEKILTHTGSMLDTLNDVRGEVEEVRESVSRLYESVTVLNGGQQTLRNDFHTLLEANMINGRDIKTLWRVVGILAVGLFIVGVIAVYAATH